MGEESGFSLNMVTDFFGSQEFYVVIGIPIALLILAAITIITLRLAKKKRDTRLLNEITQGEMPQGDGAQDQVELNEKDQEDVWVIPEKTRDISVAETAPATELAVELESKTGPATTAEDGAIVAEIQKQDHASWLAKLKNGLSKTRDQLSNSLRQTLFGKVKLDTETIEEIQFLLYKADVGVKTADELVVKLQKTLLNQELSDFSVVKNALRDLMNQIFASVPNPELTYPEAGPLVILVIGVNGVGKTTSIGKLAANFRAQGKSVLLCAGDTFRAAAIDQLKIWGERVGCPVIAHQPGSDPAAVAYDAVKAAISRNYDVLLIDTAGRLHNKNDLMQELNKINRIIGRDLPGAPQETWIVIDATTGQNAFHQVKAFQEVTKLTGIVLTKLDGTAKGGVALGLSDQFQLPIRYIGVGEKASDLQRFESKDYTASIIEG